jgi:hypothetical protein
VENARVLVRSALCTNSPAGPLQCENAVEDEVFRKQLKPGLRLKKMEHKRTKEIKG